MISRYQIEVRTRVVQLPLKIESSDLWRSDGTVGRAKYLTLGTSLMVVKYLLDTFLSAALFHRSWSILYYFTPGYANSTIGAFTENLPFYLTMMAFSLPFVWTGCVLTIRRLRSAQLSPWLVLLFFLPLVNLIFFKVLTWIPSHEGEEDEAKLIETGAEVDAELLPEYRPETVSRQLSEAAELGTSGEERPAPSLSELLVPRGSTAALWVSAFIPVLPSLAITYLAVQYLGSYGWGLFVAIPFASTIASPLLYATHEPRSASQCMGASLLTMVYYYIFLLLFAFEGLICLLMAAPIVAPIAVIGGLLAFCIQNRRRRKPPEVPRILGSLLVFVPILIMAEVAGCPRSPLYTVTTSIKINAPVERVWKNVVSFSRLDPPRDWLFKAGIAYPIEARIFGTGNGAVRHCIFSTGTFIEPITVWQEPRLLRFSVRQQATPMEELSPYRDIHPPHLENYLVSRKGQFLLEPTADNCTMLSGTTWYENHMGPAPYWRLWSDQIIHRIHYRVLDHVRALAEQDGLSKGDRVTRRLSEFVEEAMF